MSAIPFPSSLIRPVPKIKKPAKPKIRPISKARRAIFDKHPWLTPEGIKKLHNDVETRFEDAVKMYTYSKDWMELFPDTKVLAFNGEREHDGNLILEEALPMMSPDRQRERLQKMADRANARDRQSQPFYSMFGRFLRDFWDGNELGFDAIKFDEFIQPHDGESTYDAVLRLHGEAGVAIIKDLMR